MKKISESKEIVGLITVFVRVQATPLNNGKQFVMYSIECDVVNRKRKIKDNLFLEIF